MTKEESIKIKSEILEILEKEGRIVIGSISIPELLWLSDILEIINSHIESEEDEIISNNLCGSCSNIGCEFQSGIVRTECAFYMPPHIEPDNCGNYIVMQPVKPQEPCEDAIGKQAVLEYIHRILNQGTGKKKS